jgi:hypothetical protein
MKWAGALALLLVAAVGLHGGQGGSTGQGTAVRPTVEKMDYTTFGPKFIPPNMTSFPLTRTEKGGMDETGPYEVIPGFFKTDKAFPEGFGWGKVGGIFAETPDRVYVFQNGITPKVKPPVCCGAGPEIARGGVSGAGSNDPNLRRQFIFTIWNGQGEMVGYWKHLDALYGPGSNPHRIRINPYDPDKHLWLADESDPGSIRKFTKDGKLVMEVTVAGTPDFVFLPNGDWLAVEGRGLGNYVIRFDKDGKELMRFGGEGSEIGRINFAHCIALDKRGRLYVADIGNQRITVFDQKGKLLDTWPHIRFINSCGIDAGDNFWYFDGNAQRFIKYNHDGYFQYTWGVPGVLPGRMMGVNQFSVDNEGNLYTAEVLGRGTAQKFKPKKDHINKRHQFVRLYPN